MAAGGEKENILMQEFSNWQADTASEDIFLIEVCCFDTYACNYRHQVQLSLALYSEMHILQHHLTPLIFFLGLSQAQLRLSRSVTKNIVYSLYQNARVCACQTVYAPNDLNEY